MGRAFTINDNSPWYYLRADWWDKEKLLQQREEKFWTGCMREESFSNKNDKNRN